MCSMDRKIEKRKWTRGRVLVAGLTAAFICFVAYVSILGDRNRNLSIERDHITTSVARVAPFQESIPVLGSVQPIRTFVLDVTEGGSVVRKFLEEGAFVNVGDPIVRLDNAELRLSIIYNEANVFQQINALRSTRLTFEQSTLTLKNQLLDLQYKILTQSRTHGVSKTLYAKGLMSENEFRQSEEQLDFLLESQLLTRQTYEKDSTFRAEQIDQLERSVQTLQENLGITKRQLENLTVRAPIKGQLTSLKAEIGQSKSRGENLGQIDDIDSFKVRVEIDEHYIARVNAGQRAGFAFGDQDFSLTVATVYPEVRGGKFQVDMMFDGRMPEGIRRGQTLHIGLNLSDQKKAMVIERGGFYQKTGGQWIFVLDPGGSAAVKRPIKLGLQNVQFFEVLDGLHEGDIVITSSYETYGDAETLTLR